MNDPLAVNYIETCRVGQTCNDFFFTSIFKFFPPHQDLKSHIDKRSYSTFRSEAEGEEAAPCILVLGFEDLARGHDAFELSKLLLHEDWVLSHVEILVGHQDKPLVFFLVVQVRLKDDFRDVVHLQFKQNVFRSSFDVGFSALIRAGFEVD